jgi:signal peptidase I
MKLEETQVTAGAVRKRKPWAAANLSLLLAGLGQVYCGDIRRGLAHMWIVGGLLLLATGTVVAPISWRGTALLLIFILWLVATAFSAKTAYQSARRTREDYRIKDYNRPWCYAAFIFLFLIPVIGFGSLMRANFVEVFVVPTKSMEPTIPRGSRVVVRKDSYNQHDPQLHDLVVFKNPENRQHAFVKRVVATAGDEFEIRDGVVWVNDKPLDETTKIAADSANFAKITIPAHHCFVLGDQRENSKDSRHFGPVPHIALIGRVMFPR